MTTTLLTGFYGRRNCGDDAMLAVSAWAAREFLGATRLYATAARGAAFWPEEVRHLYLDPHTRGTYQLNRLREAFITRRVASIIFGGGSIFHSDHDLRRYETWMLRARGGPRFAAGVSVGPFKTHTAETICSRILHAMAFVGVRDTASLERVRFLAPSARTELTFDIAPLLLTHVQPCEQSPPVGRELAISLCALRSDPPDPRWLSELTVSLSRLSRRALFDRVALVDFNAESFDSERSDRQLHLRLARALSGHVRVEHVPYAGNPRLIASRLEGASAVLAMRLHAAVFAYVMRKPCVVIRYHEKSTQWCREIGLPDSLSVDKNELVATELETMLEAALSFTPPRPTLPVEKAIERSLRNWTWMRGSIAGCPA